MRSLPTTDRSAPPRMENLRKRSFCAIGRKNRHNFSENNAIGSILNTMVLWVCLYTFLAIFKNFEIFAPPFHPQKVEKTRKIGYVRIYKNIQFFDFLGLKRWCKNLKIFKNC